MDPSEGRLTYLLTDIEGSSTLWERAHDSMKAAVPRHDEIAAYTIEQHGGRLLKHRGEGDSLFAVFTRADNAVRAAYDLQLALTVEPWPTDSPIRVRLALNTGEADLQDDDYRGDAVNRCGRLREIAHGGQVLLGAETAVESENTLPAGIVLLDLGSHLLRGLLRPERIFQLSGPGLASDFPAIESSDVVPTNIPFRRNPSFVGREEALASLDRVYSETNRRPIALVGMTGIGKTQLAVEYAHTRMLEFPGGVFWVNARDAARFMHDLSAVGGLMGLSDGSSAQERARRTRDRLQRIQRPALLICDGVTEESDLTLLPAVGLCRIMVTTASRHVVPPDFELVDLDVLSESASLSLLQTRRQASGGEDLEAAAQLAGMLGYLPLALALAAHHVERLSIGFAEYCGLVAEAPIKLLTRARQRFISETGHDGAIYDAIAVSYASLDPLAQRTLGAASCFDASGIPTDLLLSTTGIDDRIDFSDAVAAIIDESLAVREEDGRVSLHQLVRHFAHGAMSPAERRAAACHAASALTSRHVLANERMLWREAGRDVGHCRAIAQLCRRERLNESLHPLLLQMGTHLFHLAELRSAESCLSEGLQIVERLSGRKSREAALFLRKLGEVRQHLHDYDGARNLVMESMAIAEEVLPADDPELCEYELSVGYVFSQQQAFDQALEYYHRALAAAQRSGQNADLATCLNNIGAVYYKQGRLEDALSHFEQALAIDQSTWGPDHYKLAIRLNNVGRILGETGRWEEAILKHIEAARIYEATYGRRRHPDVAASLYFAGRARRHLGQQTEARRDLTEAQEIMSQFDDEESQVRHWIEDELLECE